MQLLKNRKLQIGILVTSLVLFCIVQVSAFKQDLSTTLVIAGVMFLCFFAIAGILFWILNAKRLGKEIPPWISYFSTYRLSMTTFLICFLFSPVTKDKTTVKTSAVYASSVTHHCQWCGKEYHHTGYFHMQNECVHPQEDIGTDECCSEKCCMKSWNSKR